MAYTKLGFTDGETPLDAEHFNHMEGGIADMHAITETTTSNEITWDGVVGDRVTVDIDGMLLVRVSDYAPEAAIFTEQGFTIKSLILNGETQENSYDAETASGMIASFGVESYVVIEPYSQMPLFVVVLQENADVEGIVFEKAGTYFASGDTYLTSLTSPLLSVPTTKIKKSALPLIQADMAQTDSTQPDYVKNNPFPAYVLEAEFDGVLEEGESPNMTTEPAFSGIVCVAEFDASKKNLISIEYTMQDGTTAIVSGAGYIEQMGLLVGEAPVAFVLAADNPMGLSKIGVYVMAEGTVSDGEITLTSYVSNVRIVYMDAITAQADCNETDETSLAFIKNYPLRPNIFDVFGEYSYEISGDTVPIEGGEGVLHRIGEPYDISGAIQFGAYEVKMVVFSGGVPFTIAQKYESTTELEMANGTFCVLRNNGQYVTPIYVDAKVETVIRGTTIPPGKWIYVNRVEYEGVLQAAEWVSKIVYFADEWPRLSTRLIAPPAAQKEMYMYGEDASGALKQYKITVENGQLAVAETTT